jgi:subtilisin family serine protease
VQAAAGRGPILVAAAGNDGPNAEPVYPAAYDGVIAVTAVDTARNPYRRAVRGDHIDIAAPGVGVWTAASVSGARQKSGTSFAAPFVTAAVSVLLAAKPGLSPQEVEAELMASAEDIGKPGKDAVYGWGLLNARTLCAVAVSSPQ